MGLIHVGEKNGSKDGGAGGSDRTEEVNLCIVLFFLDESVI